MHNVLEQGPDFWFWFNTTQFSPNTCKSVFYPNVTTFQSNCAEGLHFSAFHFGLYYYTAQNGNLMDLLLHIHIYLYTHIGFITTYILIYTYIIIQYNIYYSVYSTSQVVACALSLPLRMFFI